MNKGPKPKRDPLGCSLPPGTPSKPGHITGLASREWDRVVPLLTADDMLTEGDSATLELYCQAYEQTVKAWEDLSTKGAIAVSSKGLEYQSPYANVYLGFAKLLQQEADKLGLSPASRGKVRKVKGKEKKNTLKTLMERRGN